MKKKVLVEIEYCNICKMPRQSICFVQCNCEFKEYKGD